MDDEPITRAETGDYSAPAVLARLAAKRKQEPALRPSAMQGRIKGPARAREGLFQRIADSEHA